jgi:hypothetical protein
LFWLQFAIRKFFYQHSYLNYAKGIDFHKLKRILLNIQYPKGFYLAKSFGRHVGVNLFTGSAAGDWENGRNGDGGN